MKISPLQALSNVVFQLLYFPQYDYVNLCFHNNHIPSESIKGCVGRGAARWPV